MSVKSTKRCRTGRGAAALSLLLCAAGPVPAQSADEPIELEIPAVSGVAGDSVEMNVVLHTKGQDVAGIQIDVEAPPPLAIGITDEDTPDCWRNTELDKEHTVYAFPFRFDGQWNRLRAIVLSLRNVSVIPDSSLLFTCRIHIDAAAEAGEYRLSTSRLGGGTPEGDAIETVTRGGTVLVADPVEGSAPLSTDSGQASGGCAIQSGSLTGAGWILLVPALLLWRRRSGS